jgi:hypothetical protein
MASESLATSFRSGGGRPSAISKTNEASGGCCVGDDVGNMLPGVIESLQESPAAGVTANMYYSEKLGMFNLPSFQRQFGLKNQNFANIHTWGDTGDVNLDRDFFWCGPCMLEYQVDIPYRFAKPGDDCIAGTGTAMDRIMARPQFFYSWGAGYALTKQVEFNLGGAGTYRLDRYANFMAIMASCFSLMQRAALMKISGGGVMNDTFAVDNILGIGGSTAEFGRIQNYQYNGAAQPAYNGTTQALPPVFYGPVRDRWMVAIKTPHTNFHNSRIPRKTLDMNLMSSFFNLRVFTSSFQEVCDSGVGIMPVSKKVDRAGESSATAAQGFYYCARDDNATPFLEHIRQWDRLYELPGVEANLYVNSTMNANMDQVNIRSTGGISVGQACCPSAKIVSAAGNPTQILTPQTLPAISLNCIVSAMNLTNPELGAYNVLKTRLDQAVYYPFQHFTTQSYLIQDHPFKYLNMLNMINLDLPDLQASTNVRQLLNVNINIPVNPLTAMYIMVFREKDRVGLPISGYGNYSPALFWNGLKLPRYYLSYGQEVIHRKDSYVQHICDQLYNKCTPITIPYKGGFCTRSEACATIPASTASTGYSAMVDARGRNSGGRYNGVLRTSYMYEFSLCEIDPVEHEAIMQQTPSFLGEQLNFSFVIEPTLSALQDNPSHYDTHTDMSYLDFYSTELSNDANAQPIRRGQAEVSGLYNNMDTETGVYGARWPTEATAENMQGIPPDQKGYGPGTKANPWVLNNGNLLLQVVYAQNALWQLNPNFSKILFARG